MQDRGLGMFIAIDGIDGAGKTTLVRQLSQALSEFYRVITTKEPTDKSHWGQQLRAAAINGRLPREKEIEFFHRDRIEHIKHVIKPALDAGTIVITDRYVDSLLAFQTDSPDEANDLYDLLLPEILVPDITFILDCPSEIGLGRITKHRGSTTQFEKTEYLDRARVIYESRTGDNYVHIDASGTAADTLSQAVKELARRFPFFPGSPIQVGEIFSEWRLRALAI